MIQERIDTDLIVLSKLPESEAFWHMCSACFQAKAYMNWTLEDLERLFIPPIRAGNYLVFANPDSVHSAQAFCTWAWLSEEESSRVRINHLDPRSTEWSSGDQLWIIDLVSPLWSKMVVARYLQQKIFKGAKGQYAFALRRDPSGRVRKIGRWPIVA